MSVIQVFFKILFWLGVSSFSVDLVFFILCLIKRKSCVVFLKRSIFAFRNMFIGSLIVVVSSVVLYLPLFVFFGICAASISFSFYIKFMNVLAKKDAVERLQQIIDDDLNNA